jgi:hypothetical protein
MITLRKVVAITATSALALVGAASTATAQTSSQSTIPTAVKVTGPSPANVSAYAVTTTCNLLQATSGTPTQSATLTFPAAGGTFNQTFSFTPASNCTVKVVATGSGASNGFATIAIGGSVRASGQLGTSLTLDQGANATAVTGPTNIDITITYPSFTVKKVVVGDEATAGFDYQMAYVCYYNSNPIVVYSRGIFTLKKDATKTFSTTDIPELVAGSTCHVTELNSGGAAGATIATEDPSKTPTAVASLDLTKLTGPSPFVTAGNFGTTANQLFLNPGFASGGFSPGGSTVTVTNNFQGDLIVSKVVVGDPKSNIAVYEINVSCNNNGPRESFLLKDRQSKIFTGIATGTSCLVSETRSDGATPSYSDNSGDNATDGRVTIKGTATGCIDTRLSAFPDCRANVIVTNTYGSTTTTAAAAPTTAAAAVTTAAPVAPAPVEEPAELDETEETVG